MQLEPGERATLEGADGQGAAMAMRVVTGLARASGAERLVEIASVHIDGCLYHGQAGVDFAERLVELGARTTVPTTLNVGSLDLLHPGMVRTESETEKDVAAGGRRLATAYEALGARPTWTCAPYQADVRPARGEHIAWAESNAIVFANSVLGARTDRYGDFLDVCAAVTGRAPYAGLHLDENRRGEVVLDCRGLGAGVLELDLAYPLLGYLAGEIAGTANPVFVGLPPGVSEDRLKALGAAAASAGGVALFHVVGTTPEAPTLDAALHDRPPEHTEVVTPERLASARRELSTAEGDRLDAVSVGTPHASLDELRALADELADGPRIHTGVAMYASTGRTVLERARQHGIAEVLQDAGVRLVVDTCTYVTSILDPSTRVVMTNSGKWAHYAPANLGVDVVLASLSECVASARAGRVVLDDGLLR
ncbi:aconitase X catalytic domain-containing protein [Solicola gregarius]|uniref:Aconitase X catalytic domain-containing protein n=1 Tax=Solicola gregarius TaxID=2908642 RepID=A0AA46TDS8_9ACTN|nr:aconitase X catalytic domain-containing protein [Solicola gregarius]UYM03459.1 aconitase X catalytic domain-containing protein [Solicola gregarius]